MVGAVIHQGYFNNILTAASAGFDVPSDDFNPKLRSRSLLPVSLFFHS
jgi:hypothetical protein